MNKTIRMLALIKKNKKTRPTYLNWKTFNAKQTWIHVPKILNILKKISGIVVKTAKQQLKMQQRLFYALTNKIKHIQVKQPNPLQNGKNEMRQIAFSTIFRYNAKRGKEKRAFGCQHELYIKHENVLSISKHYIMHMLLLNMYQNIKRTTNKIITLPRKRTLYTVLKSPHADKKAREQFIKEIFNVRIALFHHAAVMQHVNSMLLSYTKAIIHSYKYDAYYQNFI